MRFGSAVFFLWLAPCLALMYAFFRPRSSSRWIWLLGLSVIFLASRGLVPLAYTAGLTGFTCWAARGLTGNRIRFWFSIAVCIGAWFAARVYTDWGLSPSYLTFFLLSYLIEVYWGRLAAPAAFGPFAAGAVSLSYITAGPVPRPNTQLQQVQAPPALNGEVVREALLRIVAGVTKKALADAILQWSEAARAYEGGGSIQAWTLELLRAARVYADFSGYADIAIGVGLLLGHRLPEDFRLPFLATSVSSYWRRWNASISAFFIHYVFTPLSLSLRRWPAWTAVALSSYITLTLSGLWHGFTGNQLAWGLLVGTAVLFEGGLQVQSRLSRVAGGAVLGWVLTFYIMCLARVFSLENSLPSALSVLSSLHGPVDEGFRMRFLKNLMWAVAAIVLPHLFDWWRARESSLYKSFWRWSGVTGGLLFVWWFFSDGGLPFVYEGY